MPTHDPTHDDALWTRWLSTRDAGVRDELLRRYDWIVHRQVAIARRMTQGAPFGCDLSEIESTIRQRLWLAIEKCDPARQSPAKFLGVQARYARIDALRNLDPHGRLQTARWRSVIDAIERLSQRLQRNPDEAEVAVELGWSIAKLREVTRRQNVTFSIDAEPAVEKERKSRRRTHADVLCDRQEPTLLRQQRNELFRKATRSLSLDDQVILYLHFLRGATLLRISEAYGLSESRISQALTHSLNRLAEDLDRDDLLDDWQAIERHRRRLTQPTH